MFSKCINITAKKKTLVVLHSPCVTCVDSLSEDPNMIAQTL